MASPGVAPAAGWHQQGDDREATRVGGGDISREGYAVRMTFTL